MSEIVESRRVDALLESATREWPANITVVGYDFSSQDLRWVELDRVSFFDCNFYRAEMNQSEFKYCHFDSCNMQGIRATGATFKDCVFETCAMHDSEISEGSLRSSKMIGGVTIGSNWMGIDLYGAQFQNVIMSNHAAPLSADQAMIGESKFTMCELDGASFEFAEGMNMTFERCGLSRAVMSRAQLHGLMVRRTSMVGSFWQFTQVHGGSIEFSELRDSSFVDSEFRRVDFVENFGMAHSDMTGWKHTPVTAPREY